MVMKKAILDRLGVRRVTSAGGVDEYRLQSNGLSILLKEDPSTTAVNFMVVYLAGSRNEGAGTTGSAHFFEHLMFKGTRAFDPLEGNGVFEIFNRVGGILNANTSYDRTRYFECVPAEQLELCVRIEADRMRNAKNRKSDRDSEMTVVRNEFERNENNPGSALYKEVLAAAFKEHPYHHPVIGSRSDVEGIPMQRMVEFYDTYYWPNNATVIVVGNFKSEDALRHIAKYFGRIKRSPKPIPTVYTREPVQQGERRVILKRAGALPIVMIAHHIPEAAHPDAHALQAMAMILGGSSNPSSRLYKALVEKGMASSVGAAAMELRDPGLAYVSANLTKGTKPEDVEAAILAELKRLADEPVSELELQRVKQANRKGTVMQLDDPMAYTNLLSNAVGVDTWKWSIEFDDKFDAVTAADIQRVAATYFGSDNRTVGTFIPTSGGAKAPQKGEETKPRKDVPRKQKRVKINAKPQRTNIAAQTSRTVLPNGLTVLHVKRGKGSVAINSAIFAGSHFAPADKKLVASIAASMLTAGSEQFSKEQIGALMQSMGTSLSFSNDLYTVKSGNGSPGHVLAVEDFDWFIGVLADVVQKPKFDEGELRKKMPLYQANVANQLQDNGARAGNAFNRALYPEGHPFRQSLLEDNLAQLDTITVEDLRSFHAEHYSPQGMVITVVGDIDEAQALAVITKHFGAWSGPARKPIVIPAVSAPLASADQPREVRIALPDKANVDILIGHATTLHRANAKEFFAAKIAANVLGEDTIADRLGKVVRAKHGLTYGINCFFSDSTYGSPSFRISVSVAPENIGKARKLIDEVVSEYRRNGVSAEELEDKIGSAYGNHVVGLRNSSGISGMLISAEVMGLGVEGVDAVVDGYTSVTKADVDAAIAKFLDLSNSVTVMAGTFAN
jgi:zinc protease